MGDYNEMLITNAGGDKPKQVSVTMRITGPETAEVLRFTNLPMDTVKQAIDVLNGDPVPAPHTEDFTLTELFPPVLDGFTSDYCKECGVRVEGRHQRTHTIWHNKLLP